MYLIISMMYTYEMTLPTLISENYLRMQSFDTDNVPDCEKLQNVQPHWFPAKKHKNVGLNAFGSIPNNNKHSRASAKITGTNQFKCAAEKLPTWEWVVAGKKEWTACKTTKKRSITTSIQIGFVTLLRCHGAESVESSPWYVCCAVEAMSRSSLFPFSICILCRVFPPHLPICSMMEQSFSFFPYGYISYFFFFYLL